MRVCGLPACLPCVRLRASIHACTRVRISRLLFVTIICNGPALFVTVAICNGPALFVTINRRNSALRIWVWVCVRACVRACVCISAREGGQGEKRVNKVYLSRYKQREREREREIEIHR